MAETFLRLPTVTERTTLSKSEIYRRMESGTFPKQVRLSHKRAVWCASEIDQWMDDQVEARNEQ